MAITLYNRPMSEALVELQCSQIKEQNDPKGNGQENDKIKCLTHFTQQLRGKHTIIHLQNVELPTVLSSLNIQSTTVIHFT